MIAHPHAAARRVVRRPSALVPAQPHRSDLRLMMLSAFSGSRHRHSEWDEHFRIRAEPAGAPRGRRAMPARANND
jgi:hypothetical protein